MLHQVQKVPASVVMDRELILTTAVQEPVGPQVQTVSAKQHRRPCYLLLPMLTDETQALTGFAPA